MVDAAIATGFALAVTYVDAGNIGVRFMLTHMEGGAFDYGAKPFLSRYVPRPTGRGDQNATLIGARAAAVPNSCRVGCASALRIASPGELIKPAIELAQQGFMPAPL